MGRSVEGSSLAGSVLRCVALIQKRETLLQHREFFSVRVIDVASDLTAINIAVQSEDRRILLPSLCINACYTVTISTI